MKLAVIFVAMLLAGAARGQSKYSFHSQNFVGIIGGESDAAIQIQTINGVKRDTWFAGLGTGLDYYYQRTVPLFLSATKYFTTRRNSMFLSLDGGTNFLWDNTTANSFNGFRNDGDFTPSLYYGAHFGYRAGVKKNNGILMSIGYSHKRLKEKLKTQVFCTDPPCTDTFEEYNYKLNRYSFRLGWTF
jgi:hypothetical protein